MNQVRATFVHLLLGSLALALGLSCPAQAAAQQKAGIKYAFLVGVGGYDHSGFANLDYTLNDVHKLGDVLQRSDYHVTILSDKAGKVNKAFRPTRENILARLKALLPKLKRHDLIVIALAGHGLQFDRASYFCPSDGNPHKAESLLSFTEVYKELGECGAGVKLLLVDACREDPKAARGRGVTGDSAPRPPQGVAALFSCSAGQKSWETKKHAHGVFMYYVLEGLKGKAKDGEGEVTWLTLSSYVARQVQREVPTLIPDAEQKPSMSAQELAEYPVLVNLNQQTNTIRAPTHLPEKVQPAPVVATETVDGTRLWLNRLLAGRPIMGQGGGRWHIITDEVPAPLLQRTGLRVGDILVRVNGQRAQLGQALNFDSLGAANQVTLQIYRRGLLQEVPVALGMAPSNSAFARLVRNAADNGQAQAQYLLGNLYFRGEGVTRDPAQAATWYRKAADQNHPQALNELGDLYQTGSGVTKDLKEAHRLYLRSANLNYARAMVDLGDLHYYGNGVPEDNAEALRWYHKAARHNWAPAMHQLGHIYRQGHGVDRNLTRAAEYYRSSADWGWAPACLVLGRLYAEGKGVSKDDNEAANWFKEGAALDDAESQAWLGWAHAAGLGVEKDLKQAASWYRLSADQNNPEGLIRLAECHEQGWGEVKDAAEAARLFRRAADLGHSRAMYKLGNCYAFAKGVNKNFPEAMRWYQKAADKGETKAMVNMGVCFQDGLGVTVNRETAISWYRRAATLGDAHALKKLQGLGVSVTPNRSNSDGGGS